MQAPYAEERGASTYILQIIMRCIKLGYRFAGTVFNALTDAATTPPTIGRQSFH